MEKKTKEVELRDQKLILEKATAPKAVLSTSNPKKDKGGNVVGTSANGDLPSDKKPVTRVFKQSNAQRKSFRTRMLIREERKRVQEKQRALEEAHREALKQERRRIEQRRKQREENDRKSAVVQRITNSMKLKKLTPKQLKKLWKM